MPRKHNKPAATREAWLRRAVDALRPMFADKALAELPADVRVSCGFPGGGSARKRIGECWPTTASDGVAQVFVSPVLDEPVEVLATLAHELVHVYDDCKHGHKAPFARVAKLVGLTGKMTATVASDELAAELAGIAEGLGKYPHAALSLGMPGVKKQSTRMLKVECPSDGYTARMTRKWIDELGTPTCPCGTRMVES